MKRLILIMLFALSISGCFSRVTADRGAFDVLYPSEVNIENFNKPILVGSKLRFFVRKVNSDKPAEVIGVKIVPQTRAKVLERSGDSFLIQATEPGPFSLRIEAKAGETPRRDVVHMRAMRPSQVRFDHSCTSDGNPAVYPAGANVFMPVMVTTSQGQPMIGWGNLPISVGGVAKVIPSDEQHGVWLKASKPGNTTLRAKVGESKWDVRFLSTETLNGMRLWNNQQPFGTLVGYEDIVTFEATFDNVPMCDPRIEIRAHSKTPEICSVSVLDDEGKPNRFGDVRVKGLGFGVCEFVASFPVANGKKGVTQAVRIPIGKMPTLDATVQTERPIWLGPLLAFLAPLLSLPLLISVRRKRRRKHNAAR